MWHVQVCRPLIEGALRIIGRVVPHVCQRRKPGLAICGERIQRMVMNSRWPVATKLWIETMQENPMRRLFKQIDLLVHADQSIDIPRKGFSLRRQHTEKGRDRHVD